MQNEDIAKRLRSLRERAGATQDEVAEACDISRVTLARYENGSRMPVIKNAARLAKYYGVKTDYLVGSEKLETVTVSFGDKKRADILAQLESLPDDKLDQVLEYAQFLAGRQEAPHKAGKIETTKTDIQHK